jgi:Neocarzinostatin family
MHRFQQRTRLGVVVAASFVLLVLVLPQVATGIGLGSLASRVTNSGSCGSGSGSSGSGSSSVCGPPTLTATPSVGLADGQTIIVTGSGFTPFVGVGMVECQEGATGPSGCDISTLRELATDGSGSFSTPYTVTRVITTTAGKLGANKTIDCALSPCFLGAADVSNYSVAASVAIGFNPKIPPVLRGTLTPTDTVNPHTGVAEISGTVSCTQPLAVQLSVDLDQHFGRFNFENYGYSSVNCGQTKKATKWTLAVPPGIGLFGVGKATVVVDFSTQIGNSYRNVEVEASVILQRMTTK